MKFREDHGLRIGDQVLYDPQGGTDKAIGTVVGIYTHFILVRSDAGYNTAISNADLRCQYGWD